MKVEKAGMGDVEALVKMRLNYVIEDNGSLDAQDLAAIKSDQGWTKHRFMRFLSDR